jgi:hypothetical protein
MPRLTMRGLRAGEKKTFAGQGALSIWGVAQRLPCVSSKRAPNQRARLGT